MSQETCWTLIKAAADQDNEARSLFARSYLPVVRAYLAARWKNSSYRGDIDDAVQEVFVECFRTDGVLASADPERRGNFHKYLLGAVRNVAARRERQRARQWKRQVGESFHPERIDNDDTRLSKVFDRAWARSIMRKAAEEQRSMAKRKGDSALQRLEILRLRFYEDLPIREIAVRFDMEPSKLHHDYAQARKEFKEALRKTVFFHHPACTEEVEKECARLLDLLK
jgi:RNA polymerase sigma-70 factor (ECF subfamily)